MQIWVKHGIKLLLNTAWSLKSPKLENRLLCYHSVHRDAVLSHPPEQFAAQVQWLREHGYRSVLVRDIPTLLQEDPHENPPWVAITFDDGYRDNVEQVLPMLTRADYVATFFVVAGMVSDREPHFSDRGYKLYTRRPMMTVQDLKILVSEGMEVASHSMTHRLATAVYSQDAMALLTELKESKQRLEDATEVEVRSFAYPYGQRGTFSTATRGLVAAAGYQVAVTTMWGTVTSTCDLLALPRCIAAPTDTLAEFAAKVVGKRDYHTVVHRLLGRSQVWAHEAMLPSSDSQES